ncbi:MAG: hypothetical protein WC701_09910 [Kiritimatiellales bacterium]
MSRNKMAGRIFIRSFFAGALLAAPVSVAAASGAGADLSVKVSTTHNQGKEQNTEQKGNASVTTTVEKETETCRLEIEIDNPADQRSSYELEWCTVSKRTLSKDNEEFVILDSGKREISLEGRATGTETVNPKPFIFTITSINRVYPANNFDKSAQTREGDTYAGYIVLVKADGKILAQESNSSRFLKDEWVARCDESVQAKEKVKARQKKKK